ncbi:MAG: hypothetical protein QGF78_02740 [Candidatus Bathyarchaeota archaeon]|nr:hypothetical protein [Candidatus Bathyarchaeota archaeon]
MINNFDELPLVKSVPGMIYVEAASGRGITKCDAIGRIASSQYIGEKKAELVGGAGSGSQTRRSTAGGAGDSGYPGSRFFRPSRTLSAMVWTALRLKTSGYEPIRNAPADGC